MANTEMRLLMSMKHLMTSQNRTLLRKATHKRADR